MTLNDHENLLETVAAANLSISLSLLTIQNPVARLYHMRAADHFKTITNIVQKLVDAQHAFDAASDASEHEERGNDLLEATLAFEMAEFQEAPVHLGDHIILNPAADEFLIFPYGSWMPVYDNMPIATRIENPEMDRLYDILAAFEEDTGIKFTAYDIRFQPTRRDE